jgi:two-component system chemotaxis response regulator CheB
VNAQNERKLRVVVIDDSRTYRSVLRLLLETDGDIEVVGEADDGAKGADLVHATKPDLVTMDLDMPHVDGLGAIRRIMAECPVPILVVTGKPSQPNSTLFEALELGALDLIVKPTIIDPEGGVLFRAVVRNLAETPVGARRTTTKTEPPDDVSLDQEIRERRDVKIIGIVGSTGGPRATVAVLRHLGERCPWPIAIVQHLPSGAEQGYARYLASATAMRAEVVSEATMLEPGMLWLASSVWQLVSSPEGPRARKVMEQDERPSANVLFRSMADIYGDAAVAIMLSGSSLDGIEGMRELRSKGGLTIVEDDTSTTQNFGPRRAVAEGVAERVMSAQLIASTLAALAQPQRSLSTVPPPA